MSVAMARSTAQVAPAARRAQYEAAIATLQATGAPVTAEAVWRITGGRRANVQNFVRAWKAVHPEATTSPGVVEAAPAAVPAVSYLRSLRVLIAELDEEWRDMERTSHQLQQRRAQAHADYRNGVLEAARLTPKVRQADAQATRPTILMQDDAAHQRAQLRADLAALVGEAEVQRVLADGAYRPWWLEA